MNHKGQIGQLSSVVTTLILVGMLFGVGILILGGLRDASYTTGAAGSVTNETLTAVGSAAYIPYAQSTLRGVSCAAPCSTCVINATGSAVIPAADYTVSGCSIKYVTNSTEPIYNGTNWKVSYAFTWSADSEASNATNSVAKSTASLSTTWIPVIVVILAAGIILVLLMNSIGSNKRK